MWIMATFIGLSEFAAGVLIPEAAGRRAIQAGFSQLEAQASRPGRMAEVACVSEPWTVMPMVVVHAAMLRVQALVLPVKALVLGGH